MYLFVFLITYKYTYAYTILTVHCWTNLPSLFRISVDYHRLLGERPVAVEVHQHRGPADELHAVGQRVGKLLVSRHGSIELRLSIR